MLVYELGLFNTLFHTVTSMPFLKREGFEKLKIKMPRYSIWTNRSMFTQKKKKKRQEGTKMLKVVFPSTKLEKNDGRDNPRRGVVVPW